MVFKSILVTLMVMSCLGDESTTYTPEIDQYVLKILIPLLNPLNGLLFDGPASVSNAPAKENKNKLPSVEQMNYYMYYAAAAYYGYDLKKLSCKYCSKFKDDISDHKVIVNNIHNTLGLVTVSEKRQEIVVAYRGSWNIWNYVLSAISLNSGNGKSGIKIHAGFRIAAESLYPDTVRALRRYLKKYPDFKIVLAGHSLGGAIARIIYYFLADSKTFPSSTFELYTYGEPRVGNINFADFMNCQQITTARVVARADIICHYPPTSILGTNLLINDYFIHPQTEFWIDGKKNQHFCNNTFYEDPACSMSMGPLYSLIDHVIYFDVNISDGFGQLLSIAHLPFGLLNPFEDLPPLPKPLENILSGVTGGTASVLSPLLG
ncbi:Lipase [Pseudolycoriella hygida]|uniref:Lipase n=1 Tax=Pseudolycoriella hygida TaxID=35572 RepID=A0A9Q0MNA7_9DIPT|nr:Lipase [Pseudolycoriella hygida]